MEAARLAGCSRDTIVRARRSGRLPNARLEDGHWAIPATDLAAAGLYEPTPNEPSDAAAIEPGAGTSAGPVIIELARAEAKIAGLEDVVARQDEELRFLRLTVEMLARRRTA